MHRTPTFTSSTIGDRVWLKAELFQKTGSFKARGVLNKLGSLLRAEKERGVIGISAGNHAQALAWGAAAEGIDCLVVMWRGASEAKIAATRGYGAVVDLEAAGPAAAFTRLEELIAESGRTLVHPFDDPLVIAGQGTVALELLEDAGGGDDRGPGRRRRSRRRHRRGRPRPARRRRRAGALDRDARGARSRSVGPVRPDSIADGLSAPFAGEGARPAAGARHREPPRHGGGDRGGIRFLYTRAKLAAEPAAAVGLAAVLAGKVEPSAVGIVVSGGNVAAETALPSPARR